VAQKKRKRELQRSEKLLLFSPDHLWLRVEDGCARIGLSERGQDDLGTVIAVELPDVGETVERGAPFGELESVRTVKAAKPARPSRVVLAPPRTASEEQAVHEADSVGHQHSQTQAEEGR